MYSTGKVIAYGEFGLDYDRLHYSNKETQLKAFKSQLNFISTHLLPYKLPLFLHNRNTGEDFYNILYEYKHIFECTSGVVHSFDGTLTDLNHIINLNLYIGIHIYYIHSIYVHMYIHTCYIILRSTPVCIICTIVCTNV